MSLRYKELSRVTENDLQELARNAVQEGREIEYKTQLPGASDRDKKEFLRDVSSFANCIGGDLVFGVTENQGVATGVPGVENADFDAEKLRLEHLIRDGIQLRIIPAVNIHSVLLSNSKTALIVRVPRSLAQPHVVTIGGVFEFYSRNSGGKYRLDVNELRVAFLGSQEVIERIRNFRLARIALITTNEGPVLLPDMGRMVLHIVPFRVFEPGVLYDVSSLAEHQNVNLVPMWGSSQNIGYTIRHNFDGVLTFVEPSSPSYLQLFRNGAIEAVDVHLLFQRANQQGLILSTDYENELIEALGRFLLLLQTLGVDPPLALMLTLTGVKGCRIGVSFGGAPIDRDILLVPEVVLQDYGARPEHTLRPIFDAVWNAAGFARCPNYDSQGNRRPYTQAGR